MSTIPYNSNEAHVPPVAIVLERSSASARSEESNFLGSQPSLQSLRHDGNDAYNQTLASDDDLITAAQRGDQQAFVELCERYSPVVKLKILRIVRNYEDAEDALQDTLLRAYTHMLTFRRSCKFSTWLTAIGVNSALMVMRKRRVRREPHASISSLDTGKVELQEPIDRSLGPEGVFLKEQAILLVKEEVEKLHPSLRSAVSHYYGSDCTLKEAAKALDISLSAVKARLMRGRIRLRSSLARYGTPKFRN